MDYICAQVGVDSSIRFSFRAQTHRPGNHATLTFDLFEPHFFAYLRLPLTVYLHRAWLNVISFEMLLFD